MTSLLGLFLFMISIMGSISSEVSHEMNVTVDESESLTNKLQKTCLENELKCQSRDNTSEICIKLDKKCDGTADCLLGDDEAGCVPKTCSATQIMCEGSEKCVPHEWVCDGSNDCGDSGWDESAELCKKILCPDKMFRCSTGRCIPLSWLCDSTPDCPNNEDEPPSCLERSTSTQKPKTVQGMDFMVLFDFTTLESLDDWREISDTVREVGKSKAAMVLQKTRVFHRAVFFSMLNPQPNGACFAGYRTRTQLDLLKYKAIELRARGQGQNVGYKINLRHRGLESDSSPSYEHMFEAPREEFGSVKLLFTDFMPYHRGRKLNVTEVGPLDLSNITSLEIQTYGGVYLPTKQSGTSSLEIDWIKAVK